MDVRFNYPSSQTSAGPWHISARVVVIDDSKRKGDFMTRAARLVEYGKPLEIQDVDLREPGPDEVVIELLFAGVNPIDRNAAEGRAPTQGPVPRTLGGEGSGRLEGKPVLVFSSVLGAERDGTWAEAVVAPREYVFDLPEGVDMQEVAAM